MEQVGGDHYKSDYQHWDWAVDVGLGPLEYGATRYICRHWKKGGIEDLQKAQHFIEKIMELERDGNYKHYKGIPRSKRSVSFVKDMSNFAKENKIPYLEASLCEHLAKWENNNDLFNILSGIVFLIQSSQKGVIGRCLAPGSGVAGAAAMPSPAAAVGGAEGMDTGDTLVLCQPAACPICGKEEIPNHVCGEEIQ